MDKIKNIAEGIKGILDHVLFMHQSPSGQITMNAKEAKYFISRMEDLQRDAEELEKIQNYTNASTVPAKKEEPYKEMVSHPDHYQGNKIECIEAMLDVFGKEKVSAFCELNAFKYIWRSDSKGTDVQDKRKAIWYLDKYNELKEKARCFFYPKNGHHYEVLSSVRAKNPSNGEWFEATLYTDGKGAYVRETEDFNNKFVDES